MSSRLAMLFVVGYSNGQRSLTIIQKKKIIEQIMVKPKYMSVCLCQDCQFFININL